MQWGTPWHNVGWKGDAIKLLILIKLEIIITIIKTPVIMV